MPSRRELLTTALMGTTAAMLTIPTRLVNAAVTRDLPDLAVAAIEWSEDWGGSWSTNPVTEHSDVIFRVVVTNAGGVAWPVHAPFKVELSLDDQLLAWSDEYTNGLAKGAKAALKSVETVDGSEAWVARNVNGGIYTLSARVLRNDRLQEADIDNNDGPLMALAVEEAEPAPPPGAVSNLGAMGGFAGSIIGGSIGGLVGGAVGGVIGNWAGSRASGELGSSTPIGYNSQIGNGGGYFPKAIGTTATDFGTTSSLMIDSFKRFGAMPTWLGTWNPDGGSLKVFGSTSGAVLYVIQYKKGAGKAFLQNYRGKMRVQDQRNLGLWIDGFVNNSGVANASGSVPTNDGCGITNFYTSAAGTAAFGAAITTSHSRYAALKAVCSRAGFYQYDISGWGNDLGHSSADGIANSLKPSPTNGSAQYSKNGLRSSAEHIQAAVAAFGGTHTQWCQLGCARSKALNVGAPVMFWAIWTIFVRFLVRGALRQALINDLNNYLETNYPMWASKPWVASLVDAFLFASDFGIQVSQPVRVQIIRRILTDLHEKIGTTIDSAAYTYADTGDVTVYRDAIDLYDSYIRGGIRWKRVRAYTSGGSKHLEGLT